MFPTRAGYDVKVQPGIKANKAALVTHGGAQQVLPVHLAGVQHAAVVGQKGVRGVGSSLCQAAGDGGQWQS